MTAGMFLTMPPISKATSDGIITGMNASDMNVEEVLSNLREAKLNNAEYAGIINIALNSAMDPSDAQTGLNYLSIATTAMKLASEQGHAGQWGSWNSALQRIRTSALGRVESAGSALENDGEFDRPYEVEKLVRLAHEAKDILDRGV